ncbi:polysaccharide deacetylase family protein [Actinomadura sp. 3N407]|uniref:polysaccharide deacetylase family protein n=1 Tax=Actinomadura sp. 3N407 TaxID=3457423 RepID=UPI003FCC3B74
MPNGYVALTFDDGPTPATLPALLDRLRAAGARATFFNQGKHSEANPGLVRAQQRAGMWIGNHTDTHPHLPEIGDAAFQEILGTQQTLHRITGERPSLFRPPYGETSDQVRADEARLDLLEVLWTVDSRDWAGATTDDIVAAARTLQPGMGSQVTPVGRGADPPPELAGRVPCSGVPGGRRSGTRSCG